MSTLVRGEGRMIYMTEGLRLFSLSYLLLVVFWHPVYFEFYIH